MSKYVIPLWKRIMVVLLLPVVVVVATLEPLWYETKRAWQNSTLWTEIRRNFSSIYTLYTKTLWEKNNGAS
jgi:hypothetical protein